MAAAANAYALGIEAQRVGRIDCIESRRAAGEIGLARLAQQRGAGHRGFNQVLVRALPLELDIEFIDAVDIRSGAICGTAIGGGDIALPLAGVGQRGTQTTDQIVRGDAVFQQFCKARLIGRGAGDAAFTDVGHRRLHWQRT